MVFRSIPSANRKYLFLYPQCDDRSEKAKKGEASTLITATDSVHLPKPVSTDHSFLTGSKPPPPNLAPCF